MRYFKSVGNIAQRVSGNEVVSAIRKGLLHMMPLVLIGSFVLMLLNLPIPAYVSFMNAVFGGSWREIGLVIYNGTFQIMSLTALLSVSYAYGYEQEQVRSGDVNIITVMLTALTCFVIFNQRDGVILDASAINSAGMLRALIIGILSTRIVLLFYRALPARLQVYTYDTDKLLQSSLRAILPSALTILCFALVLFLLKLSGGMGLFNRLYAGMQSAFSRSGGTLLNAIAFSLVTHILWFFGLHGTNILDGIARDLFITATETNIELAAQGLAPANILTKEFFDAFVYMGGCGCTLGLMIALMLAGRNSNVNRIARYSFLPGLFNINEMMVYGLPIIFNPYYLIPFLLTPVALCITTYTAMATGLVPLTTMRVQWTTPIFISGYVSTGSVAGIALQAVNLAICVLIYIPFVRLYESNLRDRNQAVFNSLRQEVLSVGHGQSHSYLNRMDEVGVLARSLATELHQCLYQGKPALHMEYQPKVSYDGRVVGAEALLRWEHPVHGYIPPLVTLALCEEADLENKLGEWVLRTSFQDQKRWIDAGYDIKLSANVSPRQLKDDEGLLRLVEDIIKTTGLEPHYMELELTENVAVDQSMSTRHKLESINRLGVNIAIDDFGMGNSSLLYLRDLYANVVKIDISLVRSITTDRHSQGIVSSIVQLSHELDVGLVAEGVEFPGQVEKLHSLGCDLYQGFYFGRSMRYEHFLRYADTQNQKAAQD